MTKAGRDARAPAPAETDNSENGFSGTHWGPPLWTVLHMISFNYPCFPSTENRQHYFDFVHGLQFVLPCGVCRKSLATEFSRTRFSVDHCALHSREDFSRFIYNLHVSVTQHKRDTNQASTVAKQAPFAVPITYDKLKEEIEVKRSGYKPFANPVKLDNR
jgi:hypothetical protein